MAPDQVPPNNFPNNLANCAIRQYARGMTTSPETIQRDELARDIFVADNSKCAEEIMLADWAHPDHHYPYAYGIADGLITKGYRKPRTITTVEELDALPVESVVLHHGRAFQHFPAHPAPFDEYQKWKCGDGGFVRSTKDGSAILPATVLWEPEA